MPPPSRPIESLVDQIDLSLRPSGEPEGKRLRLLVQLAQQMAEAGVDPNDPSRTVLVRLGDRWSTLLMCVLATGAYRHRELRRVVNSLSMHFDDTAVSQRMMTLSLRTLERDGLVSRKSVAGKVPSVEYELSELGASLFRHIDQLLQWCLHHGDRMREARRAYDANQEP